MELRQIKHFLAVLDAGSIGDAARKIKISQPSLTKSIQLLERSVGAPLFLRSNAGMTPTSIARSLERRTRLIAAQVEKAEAEIHEITGATRGRVAIGAGPTFANAILADAVARFQQSRPAVEIVVVEGSGNELFPKIPTGELDFSFHTLPSPPPPDLACEVLLPKEAAVVIAPAGHPLARRPVVTAAELWKEPWVLPRGADPMRLWVREQFRKARRGEPVLVLQASSIAFALSVVARGGFLSFVPEVLAAHEIAAGRVAILRSPSFVWQRDIGAVYHRENPLTPAAADLLDFIRDACGARGAATPVAVRQK